MNIAPKIKVWIEGLQQNRLNKAYTNGYHWVMAMYTEGVSTQEVINHVSESTTNSEKEKAFDRGAKAAINNLIDSYPIVKGEKP